MVHALHRSDFKTKDGLPYFEIPEIKQLGWINHAFLTRQGGVSPSPYHTLNLGSSNGDLPDNVSKNRNRIAAAFGFDPGCLIQLQQMHQDRILILKGSPDPLPADLRYDAVITHCPDRVLSIKTADCIPIFIVDRAKKLIAAVHAGREGTARHITGKVLKQMRFEFGSMPQDLLVALGPAIGPRCYEIEERVFRPEWAPFSTPAGAGKWKVDLFSINIGQMREEGIEEEQIWDIDPCTHCHNDLFFSYRREGQTGRQLSFIGRI